MMLFDILLLFLQSMLLLAVLSIVWTLHQQSIIPDRR